MAVRWSEHNRIGSWCVLGTLVVSDVMLVGAGLLPPRAWNGRFAEDPGCRRVNPGLAKTEEGRHGGQGQNVGQLPGFVPSEISTQPPTRQCVSGPASL